MKTAAEIEHIRGVDAGAVLRSLLDRQLVRIAGHRETGDAVVAVVPLARAYLTCPDDDARWSFTWLAALLFFPYVWGHYLFVGVAALAWVPRLFEGMHLPGRTHAHGA